MIDLRPAVFVQFMGTGTGGDYASFPRNRFSIFVPTVPIP